MKECVFCGAKPTTNEHVLPQWLLEVIPGAGRLKHTWAAPEGRASQHAAAEGAKTIAYWALKTAMMLDRA